MAAPDGAWLVAPNVRPSMEEAGKVAQFGNVPRRLARPVRARDPLESVWVDDAKTHSTTLVQLRVWPTRWSDAFATASSRPDSLSASSPG